MKKQTINLGRGITWELVKSRNGEQIVIVKSNGVPIDRMETDKLFIEQFKRKITGVQ